MRSNVPLDYAIFQLTPTRTRCELLVAYGKETEKLASGLLKPFLAHLKAAEEQVAKGGYSIKLQPPPGFGYANKDSQEAPWFTKGTMERFVRFVSTPEVLERVSTVEFELTTIEEAISSQASESSRVDSPLVKSSPATPPSASNLLLSFGLDKVGTTPKSMRTSLDGADTPEAPDSSKKRFLRAMDARRLMLQKEQGMVFARAAAAGFDMQHMQHLLVFADCFGATRLRDATVKFMALCKKRQESGLWIEEMDLAAAEAALPRLVPMSLEGSFGKPRDQTTDIWSDMQSDGGIEELQDDLSIRSHGSPFIDGRGFVGEDTAGRGYTRSDLLQRRKSAPAIGKATSPNRMDMNGEYQLRGRGRSMQPNMDDYQDQEMAERGYTDDGAIPLNGSGSRWPPTHSPPPQRLSSNRFSGEYAGEMGNEPSVRRRSWALHPSHSLPLPSQEPLPRGNCSTSPHLLDTEADYRSDPRMGYPQNSQMGYHPNQIAYVDGNGGQGMWTHLQTQSSDQHWLSSPGYDEGPRYGHIGESGPYSFQPGDSGSGYSPMRARVEKDASSMEPGVTAVAAPAPSGIDQVVSDQDSISPPEQDTKSPRQKSSRHRTWTSPSPKRRSPSPLRKVQIGRSGMRRSGMTIIRNINYITSNQGANAEKMNGKESEASESVEETDSAMDGEDEELKRSDSLSVKDAINLFEVKKRNSNEGGKRKLSKHGSFRGSTDSATSSLSDKPVLRRWSTSGDLSRGSSIVSKSDLVDGNGDTHKPYPAENSDSIPTEEEVPGDPVITKEQPEAKEETLLTSGRHIQNFREGIDFNSDAARLMPIQSTQQRSEKVVPLPERHTNSSTRASFYAGAEGEIVQPRVQVDDSFMIPDRSGRTDKNNSWGVTRDHELAQPEKQRVSDDSLIVLSRASTLEQPGGGYRTDLHLESEMPKEQLGQLQKELKTSALDDLFMMPDRNTGRESVGWSTAVDHSMEFLTDVGQKKLPVGSSKPDVHSPKEPKGRFYEHYREKRDAKLRDESGSKKAERDARLKSMQEVLEKRKAEMTARSGRTVEKHAPSADAQLRAEKLRAFKADLARNKKEKDEEDRKRLDEMRAQRRERIAARSGPTSGISAQSSTTAPQTSLRSSLKASSAIQKLASPQKIANGPVRSSITSLSPVIPRTSRLIQRRNSTVPGTPQNPLSRSVPSLSELRKENTKPSGVRSSIQDRKSFSKAIGIPAGRASTAPLEANGMRSTSRAASVINDDKKRRSMGMGTRKSLSALTLGPSAEVPVATAVRVSRILMPEQNGSTKPTRRVSMTSTVSPEAKIFLRKGRGIGPGAGPGVRKQKETSAPEPPKLPEEDVRPLLLPIQTSSVEVHSPDTAQPKQEVSSVSVTEESGERAGSGMGMVPVGASGSAANDDFIPAPSSRPDNDPRKITSLDTKVIQKPFQENQSLDPDRGSEATYVVHVEDYALHDPATSTSCMDEQFQTRQSAADESQDVPSSTKSSPAKVLTVSPSRIQHSHAESQISIKNSSPPLSQVDPCMPPRVLESQSDSPARAISTTLGTYAAPLAPVTDPEPSYEAPTAIASSPPSTRSVSQNYPVLQASLSPEATHANTVRLRKKWGNSQKAGPPVNSLSKESPKGLRKLLNFGRKSRSSGSNTNDCISASTASEGDFDDEVTSDSGVSNSTKKVEENTKGESRVLPKHSKPSKPIKVPRSSSTMRESISKDVNFDDRASPAPRSFFSLSSFRSKSNESKSRP